MATFYVQTEDGLVKIAGEVTKENIIKSLGYIPSDFSGNFNDLKNNPFADNSDGGLTVVDEFGNVIAKIDKDGIHSIEVIAGEHILSNKADKRTLDNYIAKTDFTFDNIIDNPLIENNSGDLIITDPDGNIGFKLSKDGIQAKDVIAGDHILSNKANKSEIPSLTGYATETYVTDKIDNKDFYDIKDNPINGNSHGELSIIDEVGNIGLTLNSDGLQVKDVIAGDHVLSNKQNTLVSGTNIKTINGESILGDGELSVGTITTVDTNEYVDDVETTEITSAILEGFIPLSREFSDDFNNDFAR